jgi:hypothetical protein
VSGERFPFIMAFLGLIDAMLGVVFFLLKASIWLILLMVVLALVF